MRYRRKRSPIVYMLAALLFLQSFPVAAFTGSASTAMTALPSDVQGRQELDVLLDAVGRAETLEKARRMALAPTDAALGAIETARTLMPLSGDLQLAEQRLTDARARITSADTPEHVADELTGMMLAGLDDDNLVNVGVGNHGCHYSTGETIAIIIGLILGIIPGLILLIVLC